MNADELLNKKGFCILPFVHSCIWQTGKAFPCCMNHFVLGELANNSIEEIYSNKNDTLTNFRKAFLTDELHESCYKCKDTEDHGGNHSYRLESNRKYAHLLNDIDTESEEALINNEKIFLWDVRFSNLCNLKCLICQPLDSSRIAEEERDGGLKNAFNDVDEFINYFEKHIDTVTEMYFAGGEPLLIKDHYKILELLIKYKKFDVNLRYNTNATTISLGDKNVVDLWKQFKKVRISVSIDAGWEQFEYIRHGANWEEAIGNLKYIRTHAPNVQILLGVVVTILSLFYTRELYNYFVDENIISPGSMHLMQVYGKDYYRPSNLTDDLKEKALKYYSDWEQELQDKKDANSLIDDVRLFQTLIKIPASPALLTKLKVRTEHKDLLRKTDFYKTFPVLKDLFNNV
jgi:MoaA/NifB/PqqE/SkfB family radical SAM enzyme